MELEERITRLEDIESIRYLQAKYQRCLDTRDFDGVASCFSEDATSSYGNGKMSYSGRDAIVKFLCSVMSLKLPSTHLIHGGEIDVDGCSATGKWYLEDHLIGEPYCVELYGAAIYTVNYIKIDGSWYIKHIGYERQFEYVERRRLFNFFSLRKKTFLDAKKKANVEELGPYNRYFYEHYVSKKKHKK